MAAAAELGYGQPMGGVAQTAFGTDFSFLLDFGNNKPSIVPATVHYYPPANAADLASLKKYMHGMKN